ncbi:MAG: glutathione S-transferase family protein [Myxococcales bacterium]|nr:glutathione S-transferase family protein [Myxococcales bacterium]HIL81363.1 glutathione S-transferase family protein [Myxococcales bacterium]
MAGESTGAAAGRGDRNRAILHGVSLSPFVRKVRAVLHLKSIDYDLVNVMPGGMDSEFLEKSPLSKIPVWQEGGWTPPDSSAICAYLERVKHAPALYPSDPREFAQALFWEKYADTRLNESGGGLAAFIETMDENEVLHALVEEDRAAMASV